MTERKTSVFENALIWFGAGISMAEILTGTYFAPLGLKKGLLAILTGHLIGGLLFYLAGLIGAKTRRSAMETTAMSFGPDGARFFALLNVLQLVGWTAIMIYDGALAAAGILALPHALWCAVIGGLILVWIAIGLTNLKKLNIAAMTTLFILTLILSRSIFSGGAAIIPAETLSFGAAVELAVAMPLSWLPLISDYTRRAAKPGRATLTSALIYGLISCWMYAIGMGAALFTGEYELAPMLLKAGLGVAGLLVVVLSTVTTTFLDAWSAGISAESVSRRFSGRPLAILTAVIGMAAAILWPMDDITGFLYLIGSVFAPMAAIQITDYFLLRASAETKAVNWQKMLVWCLGFAAYRFFMQFDFLIGSTLVTMLVTMALMLAANRLQRR